MGAYEAEVLVFGPVLYAEPGGLSEGACDNWRNACELAYALSHASSGHQVWAVAGTYTPTTDTNRSATLTLNSGVAIYGGFAGNETQLSQRNSKLNLTILSGDIGAAEASSDNSYHVVTSSYADNTALLDGLMITAGYANGTDPDDRGAGMYNLEGSPSLTNVIFDSNTATYGGGMFNEGNTSPTFRNVTFVGNTSSKGGGGMYIRAGSPSLTNMTFSANKAGWEGGGLFNESGTAARLRLGRYLRRVPWKKTPRTQISHLEV